MNDDQRAPLFITGTQRSGTTLLHRIINQSDVYWSHNELFEVHGQIFPRGKANVSLQTFLDSFSFHADQFITVDNNAMQSIDSRVQAFNAIMLSYAKSVGKSNWCLKDPALTHFLPDYSSQFGKSKFVILVRDPRAVARSYLDRSTFAIGRPANWICAAEQWLRELSLQLNFSEAHRDQCVFIKYEDLILDFEHTLVKLCETINVDATAKMKHYYQTEQSQDRIHKGNSGILNKPDSKRIDRWQKTMSPEAIAIVETICRPIMQRFDYSCHYPKKKISQSGLTIARIHNRLAQEYHWQKGKLKFFEGLRRDKPEHE